MSAPASTRWNRHVPSRAADCAGGLAGATEAAASDVACPSGRYTPTPFSNRQGRHQAAAAWTDDAKDSGAGSYDDDWNYRGGWQDGTGRSQSASGSKGKGANKIGGFATVAATSTSRRLGPPKFVQDDKRDWELRDGGLHTRESTLEAHAVKPVPGDNLLEMANSEGGRWAQRSPSARPSPAPCVTEVLCDRKGLLGNPFDVGSRADDAQRNRACDAFNDYLDLALRGEADLLSLAELAQRVISSRQSPDGNSGLQLPANWSSSIGQCGVRALKESFEELYVMVKALSMGSDPQRGAIRLVCHCTPYRCHAEDLIRALRKRLARGSPPKRPAAEAAGAGPASAPAFPQRASFEPGARAMARRRQRSSAPPWGNAWGAAGVVALGGSLPDLYVCLVAKQDGKLGFPKGAAEKGDSSAHCTALREWREETGLNDTEDLVSRGKLLVDSWNCHYFWAEWHGKIAPPGKEVEKAVVGGSWSISWQVEDDPLDPNPIVLAHWMEVRDALVHPQLSRPRKGILQEALQKFSSDPPQREVVPPPTKLAPERHADAPPEQTPTRRWRARESEARPPRKRY